MMLSTAHRAFLEAQAVDPVISGAWTDEERGGIVFPWTGVDGRTVEQFRPDDPGDGPKYLWPKDVPLLLGVPAGRLPAVTSPARELVIVEGTKQYLAAASAVPDLAVVGMVGCFGWSTDGAPLPELGPLVDGRKIVVVLDADLATNRDVWNAADRLREIVELLGGEVRFTRTPGGGTAGLDDFLAGQEPGRRRAIVERLVAAAPAKLPRAPRARRRFMHPERGFLAEKAAEAAVEELGAHLDDEGIVLYDTNLGVYRRDVKLGNRLAAVELLGDDYRRHHGDALGDVLTRLCRRRGLLIPTFVDDPIANLPNGLLDLLELELHPHDPAFLSTIQTAVPWDPEATCPVYDEWIVEMAGSQVDDLEELLGQIFDRTKTATKAGLLYGPSSSGKSTILRIARLIAGAGNTSAVTLHDLAGGDRFAAANLHGSILNVAADLSSSDLADLSTFKMLTGEDTIHANRKYGGQFELRSKALLLFSMNEVPAVSETSRAYLRRVKPFRFDQTYEGREDRTIEEAMIAGELPGIQRRWIEGLRRTLERGGWGPTDPDVLGDFAIRSDRVAQWLAEETHRLPLEAPPARFTPGMALFSAFTAWTNAQGLKPLGRNRFYDRLEANGARKSRLERVRAAFDIVLGAPKAGRDDDTPARSVRSETTLDSRKGSKVDREVLTWEQGARERTERAGAAELVFDLETADAGELFTYGAGFVRLAGRLNSDLSGEPVVDGDVQAVVDAAVAGATLVAHNGLGFDLLVLAEHHGLELLELTEADRVIDTRVMAMLADPPEARLKDREIAGRYELNALASRLGLEGKTDELKRLAKIHGGFDRIPIDDPEYVAYCAGDVAATVAVRRELGELDDYARREHRLLGRLAAGITLEGFAVDRELLEARLAEQAERVATRRARLVERYGLPSEGKAPHRTKAGIAALEAAFAELDVELPTTEKTGRPALDKEAMATIIEQRADDPETLELAETVLELNGETSVYGSVLASLGSDGRVHPKIAARQASGRLSITRPGLTIIGKRGGRYVQRDVFVADTTDELVVAVDLSQIDMRAIAAHAGDEAYAELFTGDADAHRSVARAVFGRDDDEARESAKAIGHGWNYGLGVPAMVRSGIDEALAVAFDAGMREAYPVLCAWREEVRARAAAGELLDNGFGRLMRPTPRQAYTQGPALMGQGTARDLMMAGVLRLELEHVRRLRAIVHDEVVFSLPAATIAADIAAIVEALSFRWSPPDHGLEISVVASPPSRYGRRWGDAYRKEPA